MAKKIIFILKEEGLIALLTYSLNFIQGKGYGTTSIKQEINAVSKFLDPANAKLCIDAGGNIGDYTAGIRSHFLKAEVFTFEPSPTNIAKLNLRFNNDDIVNIEPYALSDFSGPVKLYSNEEGSALGSLTKRDLSHMNIDFDTYETSEAIRFYDFWVEKLQKRSIDLLKLDIEGHELSALNGFGEALNNIKVIQFEFGGCNIDTRTFWKDFWDILSTNGFKIYRITPFGNVEIKNYRYTDEYFVTTNFLAVAQLEVPKI